MYYVLLSSTVVRYLIIEVEVEEVDVNFELQLSAS